ncbi:MAG TPA: TRAP transporter large permease [Vicinamibacteria bacterium]|nr:TRAP transporter large permease [Vicinamibacteria bacterium]
MDPVNTIVLVGTFVVLIALGTPIAVGIGLSAFVALLMTMDISTATICVAQRMAAGLDRFTLLAIPFFILSGQIMNRGGIARRLIDFARGAVGMLPGGLAYVNIVAGLLFGAISGSAVAAAAGVGGFMVPRMKEQGYDASFSGAVNIASATTSLIIPPSNILIVYALAAGGVSIAALFVAGYLPGLLVGLLLMIVAGTIAMRRGYPVEAPVGLAELGRRFLAALPSMFLVVLVMGGIIAGWFTATEAGAVAVLYAFILAVVVYREVPLRAIPGVLVEASTTTAIVLLLISASMAFSWVLAYERIPELVVAAFAPFEGNTVVTLLIINVFLLAIGTVLDITPAVLIFTPVLLPLVTAVGVDPLHFGIVMVLNLCVGLCTPPVGTVLFVGCTVSGSSIAEVSRALIPLYAAMVVALLLVTFFPELALALPRWLGI